MGLSDGWLAGRDEDPTAEDVAEHLSTIAATESFTIPAGVPEEIFLVLQQLGLI